MALAIQHIHIIARSALLLCVIVDGVAAAGDVVVVPSRPIAMWQPVPTQRVYGVSSGGNSSDIDRSTSGVALSLGAVAVGSNEQAAARAVCGAVATGAFIDSSSGVVLSSGAAAV